MRGLLVLIAVLALATCGGALWRARQGRWRRLRSAGAVLTAADLGADLGPRATLLQFSSAFCAPCRTTRRVLADVAGSLEGVAHIEVDAESHLELVRRLGVLTTPTTLVLDGDGAVVRRAAGPPRPSDVHAVLAELEVTG